MSSLSVSPDLAAALLVVLSRMRSDSFGYIGFDGVFNETKNDTQAYAENQGHHDQEQTDFYFFYFFIHAFAFL